jgi:hypothetical protein
MISTKEKGFMVNELYIHSRSLNSLNRYFYKPQPLRSLEEIRKDIVALEKETEGLLNEIISA